MPRLTCPIKGCSWKSQNLDTAFANVAKLALQIHNNNVHSSTSSPSRKLESLNQRPTSNVASTSSNYNSNAYNNNSSNNNSYNSSTNNDDNDSKCKCGIPAIKRIMKKDGKNKGKLAMVCSKPEGKRCNFFQLSEGTSAPQGSQSQRGNNNGGTKETKEPQRNKDDDKDDSLSKKKKKCSICRKEGHDKRSCPDNIKKSDKHDIKLTIINNNTNADNLN